MMVESIFHKVITTENSLTQLLCNLMKRDKVFCGEILALFTRENAVKLFGDLHISTQRRLSNQCGQTDLMIESSELCIIVEVKTALHRGCTEAQKLKVDGNNYLSYLQDQHNVGKEVALAFLVPHNWKFREEVKEEIACLKKIGTERNVPVTQVFWEDILGRLPKEDIRPGTSLAMEFRLFLAEHFGPINFETEEIKLMFAPEFPLRTILKLNAVLDGIRIKAGKDASEAYCDKEESGFFLKKGKRNLLFVGYWLAFWDANYTFPICFGVENNTPEIRAAFGDAFREVYGKDPVTFEYQTETWTMGWIPEEHFSSIDAVDEIWARLEPIWNKVKTAAA